MLHLKLVRGVRGVLSAYVVQHHVKVVHILPGHDSYLNIDEEMITRAPIVDGKLNYKLTQDVLDRAYPDYWCDTFKINNILVYQTLSKIFIDTDAYIYVKQKKSTQDSQAVFFNVYKHFLGPDHVAR